MFVFLAGTISIVATKAVEIPTRNLKSDEERIYFPVVSSYAAKLRATKKAKETIKWKKIDDWFERRNSPRQVKRDLNMAKTFGASLKRKSNYKYYKGYLKRFGDELGDMMRKDLSTYTVWGLLGLDEFSLKLKVYAKYVNMIDDQAIKAKRPPETPANYESLIHENEFVARLVVRTEANRPEEFIKSSLGLRKLTGQELGQEHINYRYYDEYLKELHKISSRKLRW